MFSRKRPAPPILAAWLCCALLLQACGRRPPTDPAAAEDPQAQAAAIPVEVATVRRAPIAASYTGTANLEPENQAQVVAKTSGVLLKLLVEEGDAVRQGQVLARLDPERPRLELARAAASLKRLENDYKRAQDLFAAKLISSEAHDKIRYDLDTQKAVYDLAKLELSYTDIVAPIGGVISQRSVKEGNLVQLHQSVFRIDDFDPLLAVLSVPEKELAILKPGLPVDMVVDALPGQAFKGSIDRISPVVDAKTGTYAVTAAFRDAQGLLKSGMFGRLSIVYDRRVDALVIPREALIEEDGESAVFVVDAKPLPPAPQPAGGMRGNQPGGTPEKQAPAYLVKRRAVKTGYVENDAIEIRDGLKESERVVTVGRAALRDGSKVQVLEPTQP